MEDIIKYILKLSIEKGGFSIRDSSGH
jgi:hypothetical protein